MRIIGLTMITLIIFSCGMRKRKERIVKDSLFNHNIHKELKLDHESEAKTEILWEKSGKHGLFIIANAPFRWQLDSGLMADSGSFQLYSCEKETGKLERKQKNQTHTLINNKESDKIEKTVKQFNKNTEFEGNSLYILGGATIILVLYLLWKRKY